MMTDDDIPEEVKRGVEKALFGGRNQTRPTVVETRRLKQGSKWPRQKFDTYGFPADLIRKDKPKG
jgi:hypothetical protein